MKRDIMRPIRGASTFGRAAVSTVTAAIMLFASACTAGGESSADAADSDRGESSGTAADGDLLSDGDSEVSLVRLDDTNQATTLDPLQGAVSDNRLKMFMLGRLFEFVPGSLTDTYPALAQSVTASTDNTQYTITLRDGLTFSDGTPLTAEDVVATFERIASDDHPFAYLRESIDTVDAVDERTVVFELTAPRANFERQLTTPESSIVPEAALDSPDFFDDPSVFSGPYVPEGDWRSTSFSLIRSEAYGGPRPVVERFDVTVLDPLTAVRRVRGGEADAVMDVPGESLSNLGDGLAAKAITPLEAFYLLPNNARGLFADERIRQALAHAVDREQVAIAAFGEGAAPHMTPFPVGFYAPTRDVFPPVPDLDRARELLVGTACEDGCSFSASYPSVNASTAGRAAVALQSQLEPLGIELNPLELETNEFISRAFDGDYELNISNFGGSTYDAALANVLSPEQSGGCVFTMCENADIGAALADLFAAGSEEEQAEAADQVTQIYEDWVPIIPLTTTLQYYALDTDLEDVIGLRKDSLYWVAVTDQ